MLHVVLLAVEDIDVFVLSISLARNFLSNLKTVLLNKFYEPFFVQLSSCINEVLYIGEAIC